MWTLWLLQWDTHLGNAIHDTDTLIHWNTFPLCVITLNLFTSTNSLINNLLIYLVWWVQKGKNNIKIAIAQYNQVFYIKVPLTWYSWRSISKRIFKLSLFVSRFDPAKFEQTNFCFCIFLDKFQSVFNNLEMLEKANKQNGVDGICGSQWYPICQSRQEYQHKQTHFQGFLFFLGKWWAKHSHAHKITEYLRISINTIWRRDRLLDRQATCALKKSNSRMLK